MKTILRVSAILLVTVIVAAAIYAIVGNTTSSTSLPQNGQFPTMTDASGNVIQPPARPEGDFGGDRGGGNILEVFSTLVELAVMISIVLLIEKALVRPGKRSHLSA